MMADGVISSGYNSGLESDNDDIEGKFTYSPDKNHIEFQEKESNSILDAICSSSRWRIIPLIMFPYTACFSSSLAITFVKSLSGHALAEKSGTAFFNILPALYIGLVVICVTWWYTMINLSFKHFHTVYVIPELKAGNIIHDLLSGFIFLREFGTYTPVNFCLFMVGVAICLFAVSLLLLGNDSQERGKASSNHIRDME